MLPLNRLKVSWSDPSARFAAFLLLFLLPGLRWGLPSEFSPAPDDLAPYAPLAFAARYGDPAQSAAYPAVHHLVLLLADVPCFAGLWASGNLGAISARWPYGFRDPVAALSILILAARVVSLAMAMGILLTLRAILLCDPGSQVLVGRGPTLPVATRPHDRSSRAMLAMALLASSGVFGYYARTSNVDVPYLFWWALSFACLWGTVVGQADPGRRVLWAGLFAGLAIGTKTQAAALVLGSGLLLLVPGPLRGPTSGPGRIALAARFALAVLASYAAFAVLPNPPRWLHHVLHFTFSNAAIDPSLTQGEVAAKAFERFFRVLSPPVAILAVVGSGVLVRGRRMREMAALGLPAVTYYAGAVMTTRFAPERFLLPLAYLGVILAAIGGSTLLELRSGDGGTAGRARSAAVALGLALVFAIQLASSWLPVTYAQTRDLKRAIEAELPELVPPGSVILWEEGGGAGLPNANTYRAYRWIIAPGRSLGGASEAHLFAPYDPDYAYILASAPRSTRGGFEWVRTWEHPEWVRRRLLYSASKSYSLYRRVEEVGAQHAPGS